jgi:hypothetical protein
MFDWYNTLFHFGVAENLFFDDQKTVKKYLKDFFNSKIKKYSHY